MIINIKRYNNILEGSIWRKGSSVLPLPAKHVHTHTHTQVYTFTVSFLSQNLDRRLGNFINYEGNGERPGWYMWPQDLFPWRTDFRRSHFAWWPRDVVALLCKRMYEPPRGKQSNYERDGIRDSGILVCQAFLFTMKWNGVRVVDSGIETVASVKENGYYGSSSVEFFDPRLKILPKFSKM